MKKQSLFSVFLQNWYMQLFVHAGCEILFEPISVRWWDSQRLKLLALFVALPLCVDWLTWDAQEILVEREGRGSLSVPEHEFFARYRTKHFESQAQYIPEYFLQQLCKVSKCYYPYLRR